MKTFLISLALMVLSTSCGRKASTSTGVGSGTNQQAAASATGEEGLATLAADPNPYISNIAKHTRSSWATQDYQSAAVGMIKLLTLCRTPVHAQAAASSLASLKAEIERAVAKGNANARQAAAQLAQSGW